MEIYVSKESRGGDGTKEYPLNSLAQAAIIAKPGDEVSELMKIFSSFISDEISNFNTDLYYQNPNYLEWSYREGKLLD